MSEIAMENSIVFRQLCFWRRTAHIPLRILGTSSAAPGVWPYLFFFCFGLAFCFGLPFRFGLPPCLRVWPPPDIIALLLYQLTSSCSLLNASTQRVAVYWLKELNCQPKCSKGQMQGPSAFQYLRGKGNLSPLSFRTRAFHPHSTSPTKSAQII